MKRFISMILTLVMSLTLCVPAFAVESEVSSDSATNEGIMFNTEEVGMTESGITRDAKPPREYYDLSKGVYTVDGSFEISIYSARYFKPNENGKIRYSLTVSWLEEVNTYPLCPTMTIECWDRTTGERASKDTFESMTDHWPFRPVIYSGNQTVSGLNTDHEYYFIIRKDVPGSRATVTGTIEH